MVRLDILLALREGISREKARAMINSGLVSSGGKQLLKPGVKVNEELQISISKPAEVFISHGERKMRKAITDFNLCVEGFVCLDIGASTGGFTKCLLSHGVKKVYAVDVGQNQLEESLRNDPRVVVMEHTNARYLEREQIPEVVDCCVVDVSFISLTKILPVVQRFLKANGIFILLVKPQFEAGRARLGKHGVIKDKKVHVQVLLDIVDFIENIGMTCGSMTFAPCKGQKGNIEFLLYGLNSFAVQGLWRKDKITAIVKEAHEKVESRV